MSHQPVLPRQLDTIRVLPDLAPVCFVPHVAHTITDLLCLFDSLVAQTLVGLKCCWDFLVRRDGRICMREGKACRQRAAIFNGLRTALDTGGEEGVRCVTDEAGPCRG